MSESDSGSRSRVSRREISESESEPSRSRRSRKDTSDSEDEGEKPKKPESSKAKPARIELARSKKPAAPVSGPGIAIIKPKAKSLNSERVKLEEKAERASKLSNEQKEGLSVISEDLLSRLPAYEITGVFAGVVDPKFVKKSVTPDGVTRTFAEGRESKDYTNTIFDRRMGASDLHAICGFCKLTRDGPIPCPGHNGHMKLAHRVYNVAYFPEILTLLNCFCRDCGTLLMSPDIIRREPKFNNAIGQTKLKRISEESVKYPCKDEDCKTRKYSDPIDMAKSKMTLKVQIKTGAKNYKQMPINVVYNLLKNVSDDIYRLLGYPLIRDNITKIPITTHPKNYITKYIIVIPPYMRPNNYTKKEAELSPESKLYDNLVKMNETITKLKEKLDTDPENEEIKLELERVVDNMTQFVASLLDSEKYGSRVMHGIPMKGVRQRIQGKEADIRSKIEGKVAEYVSRQPIGPDPTIEFGQSRMPMSLMKDQTIPEKVYGGNQVELTKLLRLGKVLAVVPGSGPKKGLRIPITEENKKTIALEIGDEVHRRMRNGDVVLNNRYPSIQMYSILAATAVAGYQENLGIHMAVTKAYNADFDGDEMQTHIPQTTGALADVYASVHARRNLINAQSSRPLFGGVYDVPVATTLLSNPDTVISEIHFFNVITRLKSKEQLFTLFPRITRFGGKISRPLTPINSITPIVELYIRFVSSLPEEQDKFINAYSAENSFVEWLRDNDLLVSAPPIDAKLERYRREERGKIDEILVRSRFSDIANLTKGSSSNWERFEREAKNAELPYTFKTHQEAYEAYLPYLAYLDYLRDNRKIPYSTFVSNILPSTNLQNIRNRLSLERFIDEVAPKYNDPDVIYKLFISDNLNVIPSTIRDIVIIADDVLTTGVLVSLFRRMYPEAELEDNDIIEQIMRFIGKPTTMRKFVAEMRDRLNTQLQDYINNAKAERKKAARLEDEDEARERREDADKRELRARDRTNEELRKLEILEEANPNEKVWLNYYVRNTPNSNRERAQHEYYGTTLLSAILPAGLKYSEYGVKIDSGVHLEGIWTMDVVGTSHNSLIQAIWDQYGSERASDFITDLYFMSNYIYTQLGMTLSPSDLIIDNPKELLAIERQRTQLYEKFKALVDAFPEDNDDPLIREKYEREIVELTRDFSNLGIKVIDLMDRYANLSIIAKSKAKGKASNFAQMIVDLQQQMLYGERLKPTLRGNTVTLPYFSPNERSLAAQGFIATPYMKGLSPAEFFQHAMANRQGIVDMQTKTQDVGDDHRRLVKTMEDVFIEEDGSVRNRASGAIIQMVWGYHGFTPTQLRLFQTPTGKVAGPVYPVELVGRINAFFS